jgi:hypothetical protein
MGKLGTWILETGELYSGSRNPMCWQFNLILGLEAIVMHLVHAFKEKPMLAAFCTQNPPHKQGNMTPFFFLSAPISHTGRISALLWKWLDVSKAAKYLFALEVCRG